MAFEAIVDDAQHTSNDHNSSPCAKGNIQNNAIFLENGALAFAKNSPVLTFEKTSLSAYMLSSGHIYL